MTPKNKNNETPSGDDTEQYVKDVRKLDSDEEAENERKQNRAEVEANKRAQEKNQKSQKDAELDAPFGDSSDVKRSKLKPKRK